MPSSDAILSSLHAIANQLWTLAIVWHLMIGVAAIPLLGGRRPSDRLLGGLLVAPLLSVSVVAWVWHSPFNAAAFALLSALLFGISTSLSRDRVQVARGMAIPGFILIAFGWMYPHFVDAKSWTAYIYAAPFGLLPCPTVSLVIGVTLLFGNLRSTAWATTLAAVAFFYGVIGLFQLGVALDMLLLAGAAVLAATVAQELKRRRSVQVDRHERKCSLPESERDELLDEFMPSYDVVERHRIRVAAPVAMTFCAARDQDLLQFPLVRAIFQARAVVLGARSEVRPQPHGLVAAAQALGWGVLVEVPEREIVMGAVTKPWEPNVTFHALPPDEFKTFSEPGFVKIAWTLRADPIDYTSSVFRTETRAVATDRVARQRFRRYWAFASPGIATIRWLSLRPLKQAAERRAVAAVAVNEKAS